MSAIAKLYTDSGLTQELAKDGNGNYLLTLGPETGLDGNIGQTLTTQYWLNNAGNEIYQGVSLTEAGETPGRISYSLDGTTWNATSITFGDIAVGATKTFYVKVVVEAGATAGRQSFTFTISGESI